jgi:hypothetical protein
MTEITTLIVGLKTVTLLLGGLITYFAYKAFRRTDASSLQYLALGFAIVTLGSMLGGVVDQLLAMPREIAITTESGLTVIGFAVIVYSLYVE